MLIGNHGNAACHFLCLGQSVDNTFLSATTTIMELKLLNPPIEVWCLFIDKDHNPTFGEPFPVLIRDDQTTHDLKTKIYETPHSPKSQPHMKFSTNQIEIWKGKSLKTFSRTKELLHNVHFYDNESSAVQQVGVAD